MTEITSTEATAPAAIFATSRVVQQGWAALPLAERLGRLKRMRHLVARDAASLAESVGRSDSTETLAAEIVTFAESIRFLEREAPRLLAPRRLGPRGRPGWLFGVDAEIRREPLGVVLILAPSNYPLFLPGVQAVQALAAGNAVVLKPGSGGSGAAQALQRLAVAAGVPEALFAVLGESPEAGEAAIAAGPDKVVLTGSARTGARVLAALAPQLVPATMELSGNDAVIVLPGADLAVVAAAVAYGLRLNGGATCIAPRRVYVPRALHDALAERLAALMPTIRAGSVSPLLPSLIAEAQGEGARVLAGPEAGAPTLVMNARPGLRLLEVDVFAPVTALVPVDSVEAAVAAAADCPYALGAAVFGPEGEARRIADRLSVGVVTVNDVIVPTADPRLPFGGRRRSGFGVTRGGEGLLDMTTVKAIAVRRGRFLPHLAATPPEAELFLAYLRVAHGEGWRARMKALPALLEALRRVPRL